VNFERIAASSTVAATYRPVGPRIVLVVDRQTRWRVSADVQTSLASLGDNRIADRKVPIQLVTHPAIHRLGPVEINSGSGGARTLDPLGIGMACEHENRNPGPDASSSLPLGLKADFRTCQRVHPWRQRRICRGRQAQHREG